MTHIIKDIYEVEVIIDINYLIDGEEKTFTEEDSKDIELVVDRLFRFAREFNINDLYIVNVEINDYEDIIVITIKLSTNHTRNIDNWLNRVESIDPNDIHDINDISIRIIETASQVREQIHYILRRRSPKP